MKKMTGKKILHALEVLLVLAVFACGTVFVLADGSTKARQGDASGNASGDAARDRSGDASGNASGDAARDRSKDTSGDVSDDIGRKDRTQDLDLEKNVIQDRPGSKDASITVISGRKTDQQNSKKQETETAAPEDAAESALEAAFYYDGVPVAVAAAGAEQQEQDQPETAMAEGTLDTEDSGEMDAAGNAGGQARNLMGLYIGIAAVAIAAGALCLVVKKKAL